MAHAFEVLTPDSPPPVWAELRREAKAVAAQEPALASLLDAVILSHDSLAEALPFQIARKLGDEVLTPISLREVCAEAYASSPEFVERAKADLRAVFERDPACRGYLQPFLFFKGFMALQTHRVAHWLWSEGRETLAFYLQSRMSELFQVDIHPGREVRLRRLHRPRHRHRHRRDRGGRRRRLHAARRDPGRHRRRARRPPPQDRQGRAAGRRRQGARQHHHRRLRQDRLGLGGAEARAGRTAPRPACRRGWSTARPATSRRGPWTTPWPTSFTTT